MKVNEKGKKLDAIPQGVRTSFDCIVKKIAVQDLAARLAEVLAAGESRFYWKGEFNNYWSGRNFQWSGVSQGYSAGPLSGQQGNDTGADTSTYPLNVYQSQGEQFIALVGHPCAVRFKARGERNISSRISESANTMRDTIEANNDVEMLAMEVARYMWTDGRTTLVTDFEVNGQKYGYEGDDQDKPKGAERIRAFGVLETRTPLLCKKQSDFPWLQLEYEVDLSQCKARYPDCEDEIKGGETGPGDTSYARTTRLAVMQGINWAAQASGVTEFTATATHTWLRPQKFVEIDNEEDRAWALREYPNGCMLTHIGKLLVDVDNQNMDDHVDLMYPIVGDGQATPACGAKIKALQDAYINLVDLTMEGCMQAIPRMHGSPDLFDIDSLNQQRRLPGQFRNLKQAPAADQKVADSVFVEPTPEFPQYMQAFMQALPSDICQMLTGIFPVTVGDADPNNETKGGILAMRDASLGRSGSSWKAWRKGYKGAMGKAVRLGAKARMEYSNRGIIKLESKSRREVEVDLSELRENSIYCEQEGSEDIPRTYADKQRNFAALATAATASPQGQEAQLLAANPAIVVDYIGIPGLEVPGATSKQKQLDEIDLLLEQVPLPLPNAPQITAQAAQTGQQPSPEQLFASSVKIDPEFDDHAAEWQAGLAWVNSAKGQDAKNDNENKEGFLNVRLHLLAHKQQIDAAQQKQIQQTASLVKAKSDLDTSAKITAEQAKAEAQGQKDVTRIAADTRKELTVEQERATLEAALDAHKLGVKAGLDHLAKPIEKPGPERVK
jgi:hypothetical protein